MAERENSNSWDKKRLIIESIVAIACVILGNFWGQSSNTYYFNGIKIEEEELNAIMEDNAKYKSENDALETDKANLQEEVEDLNQKYENLESQNKELSNKYDTLEAQSNKEIEDLNNQLKNTPVINYKNLSLCIDVDDIPINTSKSVATIDGRDYFSREIVENLITEDKNLTIKDETIYIGQVVAEKAKLTDQWVMGNVRCSIEDSAIDSHGDSHTDCIVLGTGMYYDTSEIKYSVGGKYTSLKGTISVASKSGMGSKGTITIKAGDEVIYSAELTKDFTPEPIDRPINNCDIIDISYKGYSDFFIIFSDATLYNK